jgi:uncharacterized membrane protein YkvA (DUF1232 family)
MEAEKPVGLTEDKLDEKILKRRLEQNKDEAEQLLHDRDKMDEFLGRLERKLSLIPVAGKYLSDIPVLISLVKAYIEKKYTDIPIGSIIAIVSALIYFLSPIDLIPDFIPVAGFADDAAVIAFAYKFVHDDIAEYKTWRDANN